MQERIEIIRDLLSQIPDLQVIVPLTPKDQFIAGKIRVKVEDKEFDFTVQIYQQYPKQLREHETIRFINSELLPINHVNADGSVCLHTQFGPDLKEKLNLDIQSLKTWIKRYAIDGEKDMNYEHIIVRDMVLDNRKAAMLFTDLPYTFSGGEFGEMEFTAQQRGKSDELDIDTYVLQSLETGSGMVECNWNTFTKIGKKYSGLYVFLKAPPVFHGRFAVEDWKDLEPFLGQAFIDYLGKKEIELRNTTYNELHIIVGYHIPNGSVHWQMISIEKNAYPLRNVRIGNSRHYYSELKNQEIFWRATRNCSYEYFFGRGALDRSLMDKKMLVIGIGAVGSILATGLCRGGLRNICIVDYDVKEPGNVCRSEYIFYTGINNKVDELRKQLYSISPFIEISSNMAAGDITKARLEEGTKKELKDYLDAFDFVFDCSGDNSLAYSLQDFVAPEKLINLSISNGAQELVCVSGTESYKWIKHIYAQIGTNDIPLYEPTGCWSATFRAGYSDIAVLVHAALREINRSSAASGAIRNFYLSSRTDGEDLIKITRF